MAQTKQLFSENEIESFIDKNCIQNIGSHLNTSRDILKELFSNLNEWALENNSQLKKDKSFYSKEIIGLLETLRFVFCGDDYDVSDIINSSKHEFMKDIEKLQKEKKDKAINIHKFLWSHINYKDLLYSKKLITNDYPYLHIAELESATKIYLSKSWLKSSIVEWMLIDALVFSETIHFHQNQPNRVKNPYNNKIAIVFPIIFSLMSEFFYLVLTALVCFFLAADNQTIYWLIFSAITIIRWLNPNKFKREQDSQKTIELLFEMIGIYTQHLKEQAFNPILVRELLLDLSKKGAVYSHYIFHLLDRKISNSHQ